MSIDEQGMEIEMPSHDVKLVRNIKNGDICIESVPPEDFFVDRNARSIEDFYVCGHTSEVRVSDILAMGFSLDDLSGLDHTEYSVTDDEAEFERRGYAVDDGEDENISGASKKITFTQAFMELDIEGSGVPQLYQFLCVGANHTLLQFYEADHAPYSIFEIDPEPHAFFGTSLVDLTITDQDAATSMLRGILDNAALDKQSCGADSRWSGSCRRSFKQRNRSRGQGENAKCGSRDGSAFYCSTNTTCAAIL